MDKTFTTAAVKQWFADAGFGVYPISKNSFELYRDALIPTTIRVARDGTFVAVVFDSQRWSQKCTSYREIRDTIDSFAGSLLMAAAATRRYAEQLKIGCE